MHAPTFTAVVVFPTPPFWLAIAYTVDTDRKLPPIAVRRGLPTARPRRGRSSASSHADAGPKAMGRSAAERPLACNPRPPGEPSRGLAKLQIHVQVVLAGASERLDPAHFNAPQAE